MTTFSVQASPSDARGWLRLAVQCEEAGFDALLTADHPGSDASPFVALAAAAAVTSSIGLGSCVANAAVREPILLAADVATLDVVSGGRARLGLGAGHTPAEWRAIGKERPDVRTRVNRCLAVAQAVQALLAGERVTSNSPELTLLAAQLAEPRPVQARIPLTIGTANSRMLHWAGANADVVGLTGFGRTLPDGHRHEARWSPTQIEAQLECVATGAATRDTPPELEALVQSVVITDDIETAASERSTRLGLSVRELLDTPFVLIGTEDQILAAMKHHEQRWGITRYVIRQEAMEAITPILARLDDPSQSPPSAEKSGKATT